MTKKVCAVLLILSLLFSVGCGLGGTNGRIDEPQNDKGEDKEKPTDDPEVIGEFYNFGAISDLSPHFKELGVTFLDTDIDYIFMGKVTVNNVQVEHLIVRSDSFELEMWLDESSNEVVKAVVNGDEVPHDQAQSGLQFVDYLEIFFVDQNWDDSWGDAERSVTSRDLGAGNIQVTRIDFQFPGLPLIFEIEIAEIKGRNLLIRYWQVDAEGKSAGGWKIRRLIPR